MSSDGTDYTSVTSEGYTATSNAETTEQLDTALETPKPESDTPEAPPKKVPKDLSKAASKLGKAGGKASAETRASRQADSPDRGIPEGSGVAEDADDSHATSGEEPEKPLGKPREDTRARMLELAREKKELEVKLAAEQRERERYSAEFHRLSREREAKPEVAAAPKPDADPRPNAADFDSHEEFTVQLARWGARQEYKGFQRDAEVQRNAEAYAHNIETKWVLHQDRIKEAVAADPEFVQKVSPDLWALRPTAELAPDEQLTQSNVIADIILESESEAALLLHFTEHPDEFQRIATLRTPGEILRAMARLEGKLDGQGAVTTELRAKPEVSMAKPPVRPVTGSPGTADSMPREDAPYEEHKRYWDARDAKARAGR